MDTRHDVLFSSLPLGSFVKKSPIALRHVNFKHFIQLTWLISNQKCWQFSKNPKLPIWSLLPLEFLGLSHRIPPKRKKTPCTVCEYLHWHTICTWDDWWHQILNQIVLQVYNWSYLGLSISVRSRDHWNLVG